jgi:hypothetical protein
VQAPFADAFKISARLFADVNDLLDLGDDVAGLVFHFDLESAVEFFLRLERQANRVEVVIGEFKTDGDGSFAGPTKADAGGFVPDDVFAAEVFDEHEHIKRIGHGVERASVVSADVVGIPEMEFHLDVDALPIGIKPLDADARGEKRRPEIHEDSHVATEKFFPLPHCSQFPVLSSQFKALGSALHDRRFDGLGTADPSRHARSLHSFAHGPR